MNRDSQSFIEYEVEQRELWVKDNQRALRENPFDVSPLLLFCQQCLKDSEHEFQEFDSGDIFNPPQDRGFICKQCNEFIFADDVFLNNEY